MSLSGQNNQVHQLARGRRYHLGDYATGPALPFIQEWMGVLGFFSGGAFFGNWGRPPLTTKTILCVTDLVNGLMADGLWDKLLVVNAYVPDTLTACFTPVLNRNNAGFRQWTAGGGWTPGDLSVGGLTGDGATKRLGTGFNEASSWPTPDSYSMICYTANVTHTGASMGGYTTQGAYMIAQYTDFTAQSSNGVTGTNIISVASPGAGYYCQSRVSSTDHQLYFANSGTAHHSLATDATPLAANMPNGNISVHCINNIGGAGDQLFTADTISFAAIGLGLTATDSQNAFNRIQAYRRAIGGGFV